MRAENAAEKDERSSTVFYSFLEKNDDDGNDSFRR